MEIQGKKQFKFKGKLVEELKKLDVREFAVLLRSRQRRSILRNFQKQEEFVSKAKMKTEKNKPVRTHFRDLVIVPELIGMNLQIHNGNKFIPVLVTGEMLGHKFGEFAPTRSKVTHTSLGGKKAASKK